MGVTLIHEVHDMWPATLIELGGMSRKHPFIQLLQMAENSAYKKSDKVVSLPPNAEVYMTQHGLEKGKFIVGYFGGHALSNALDSLIDVACLLKDISDIHFVLVGKGVEKARLQNRCKDENLNNVTFMNAVEKRCIPSLLTHFDCIYIGLADSTLYRFGLALNKFYDAMMSGKPIILSTNVKNTVIEQNACGIIVPSEDERAIKEAILNVKNMSIEKRCEMGRKGTIAVKEKYRYEKLADDFLKVIGKEKKNILLINHYAGSPEMGMEFRPYYFAKEWVKKGYRVDIIAADYSHLRIKNPKIAKDFEEEVIDGIHYHWIHTLDYQGNGIKRALTTFQFVGKLWLHAKKIAKKLKPDVIITSSTYPLDTYAGQKIRKYVRGGVLIHEIHDMWPITPVEMGGMSPSHPYIKILQRGEDSFCKQSDIVVSLLPCASEYLQEHGMNPDKFVHISNGIVEDEWKNIQPLPEDVEAKLSVIKRKHKKVICFFGSHTISYALDYIIDAVKMFDVKQVGLLFVGGGVYKKNLIQRADNAENIYFLDSIPKGCIPALLRQIDIIYIGGVDNSIFRFGICMNKLFDSMMAGKPILYAMNAPNNYILDYNCGVSVKPENTDELIKGITALLQMTDEELEVMGQNGRKAVLENYTTRVLAEKFEKLF